MSEFTSELGFFTTAQDPQAKWSALNSVLEEDGAAQSWYNAPMWLFTPAVSVPGGVPVLPTITFNNIRIEILWRRGGREQTGGDIWLTNLQLGGGTVQPDTPKRGELYDEYAVDAWEGDAGYWGLTQQQIRELFEGTGRLEFNSDESNINGSEAIYVQWAKIQFQYTYTGQGAFPPRLF